MKEYKFHLSENICISVKINEDQKINKDEQMERARGLALLEARHLILNWKSFLKNTYPITTEEIMESKDEKRTTTENSKN